MAKPRKVDILRGDVVELAVRWWEGRRPLAYTRQQHLANPTVNAWNSQPDQELAAAVGAYVSEMLSAAKRGRA